MQFRSKMIPIAGAIAFALTGSAYAQEQVIKIGHTGPLSGPNAFAGKDDENGVRLALEELNAKKITIDGKQIKFELSSEDDQCDAKAGVNVAQKFVDAGVKFVMGPYCSSVAIPASRVYGDAGVMLSTAGTSSKVTQGGYKNLYRIIASDSQLGASLALYAAKELKVKTVGVIDDRTAFGQGLANEFTKVAKSLGLQIAGQEFTTDKATDFNAILTSLKAKKVDMIFLGGYAPQGAPMARQMKQLDMNMKLMGGETLCSPEMSKLGGDAVGDNVICTLGGAMLDKVSSGPAFKAKYKKRFNQDPDTYAVAFYDQMLFIGEAIQKAKSVDPVKVGEELRKMTYKGVAGNYSYDEKGNMKQSPTTIATFKNGVPVALGSY